MPFINDPFYNFFGDVSDALTHANRALDNKSKVPKSLDDTFTPAINVHESENAYNLKVSAAGATKDRLQIDFDRHNNILTVKGEVPEQTKEQKDKQGNLVYREMNSGKFQRSIGLPAGVDADNIKAKFTDGILSLEVPKAKEEATHKRISIE